jgi:hypothetical protein
LESLKGTAAIVMAAGDAEWPMTDGPNVSTVLFADVYSAAAIPKPDEKPAGNATNLKRGVVAPTARATTSWKDCGAAVLFAYWLCYTDTANC